MDDEELKRKIGKFFMDEAERAIARGDTARVNALTELALKVKPMPPEDAWAEIENFHKRP